jgi:hypothetical protein
MVLLLLGQEKDALAMEWVADEASEVCGPER